MNKHAVNKKVKRKIFNMSVFIVKREAFFLLFLSPPNYRSRIERAVKIARD